MSDSWKDFAAHEPDFARAVEDRFDLFVHHVIATVQKDGSPRTHGLEVRFLDGELWFGMMPRSVKALDLRRDPRFSLQANPGAGADMEHGDVRIRGRAVEVTEQRERARYVEAVGPPDSGTFHLFRTEVTEVMRTAVVDDAYLELRVWRPGEGVRTHQRR